MNKDSHLIWETLGDISLVDEVTIVGISYKVGDLVLLNNLCARDYRKPELEGKISKIVKIYRKARTKVYSGFVVKLDEVTELGVGIAYFKKLPDTLRNLDSNEINRIEDLSKI